ncbi:MAG TPA: metal-dependent hydrolase [Candidatus Thermoplasmatota archaeon]|nr:metal-dependent hydrolase [Candidatus Thermoplasmatota archaeon]
MVSWVPQIVVPPLVALAFLRSLPRRWVIALAPTTFLADIDYVFPNEHRVYTHNLLLPALLLGIVALLWRRQAGRVPAPKPFWQFARQPGWPLGLLLTAYYLAAHDVMDVFTGGVLLFWPLSRVNIYAYFEIYLNTASNTLEPQAEAGATQGPFPLDPNYPWLTAEHTAILGFLAAVALAWLATWLGRRLARREPSKNDKSPPDLGTP